MFRRPYSLNSVEMDLVPDEIYDLKTTIARRSLAVHGMQNFNRTQFVCNPRFVLVVFYAGSYAEDSADDRDL